MPHNIGTQCGARRKNKSKPLYRDTFPLHHPDDDDINSDNNNNASDNNTSNPAILFHGPLQWLHWKSNWNDTNKPQRNSTNSSYCHSGVESW